MRISSEGSSDDAADASYCAEEAGKAYMDAFSNSTPFTLVSELPPVPPSVKHIYDTHRAMVQHEGGRLGGLAGYKMGAVDALQDVPCMFGPLFRRFIDNSSPLSLEAIRCHTIEAEIAFVLSHSLPPPPSSSSPYTPMQIWSAVGSVVPCIELCASRTKEEAGQGMGIQRRLADGLMTGGVYLGPKPISPPESWHGLKNVSTVLSVNGTVVDRGVATSCPMGGPLESFMWLVQTLNAQRLGLNEGQIILTGMTSKTTLSHNNVVGFRDGDEICAKFVGDLFGEDGMSVTFTWSK